MKVSLNRLAEYAKNIDAKPQPTDIFTMRLTRRHIEWLRGIARQQVLTERKQLEYYIKRDADKHPERKTIERFKDRLAMAQDFANAVDKATRD